MTTLLGSQVRHQPSQSRNGPMLLFRGVRMRFFKYLALAILWVFPQSVAAAAKPQRIVSLNPCVDAVLMRIADPGQIAAISQYSLRSEEHTSELQSLMRISYAVFCLKKKTSIYKIHNNKDN